MVESVAQSAALKVTLDGKVTAWNTKRDELAVLAHAAGKLIDVAANAAASLTAYTTEKGNADSAKVITAQAVVDEKAKESAEQLAADAILKQYTNAVAERALAKARLTLLTDQKKLDDDALLIATHLWKIEDDKKVAEEAKKAAANAKIPDLEALKTQAKAIDDRAQLRCGFYKTYTDAAKANMDAATKQVTDTEAAQVKADADIATYDASIKLAIQECKGRGYELAQAAMAAWEAQKAQDKITYDDLKTSYDELTAAKPTGKAGARCEYPKPKADGTQDPRPLCDEKLCCGAANRFEKNGTKLTIESCQLAEGTTTYTYYPPLPAGALVQPRSETWRFSCIGGAQQLAATATAALAAVYMMN